MFTRQDLLDRLAKTERLGREEGHKEGWLPLQRRWFSFWKSKLDKGDKEDKSGNFVPKNGDLTNKATSDTIKP